MTNWMALISWTAVIVNGGSAAFNIRTYVNGRRRGLDLADAINDMHRHTDRLVAERALLKHKAASWDDLQNAQLQAAASIQAGQQEDLIELLLSRQPPNLH